MQRRESTGNQVRKKSADSLERFRKQQGSKKLQKYVVVLVLLIGTGALVAYGASALFQGCPDGIPISTNTQAVHIHVHLDVFANASTVTVPDTLGHIGANLCTLHTHDNTGVIHVESPDTRTYTLQEVLDVWGYHASSNALVYVNGAQSDFSHVLVSHDEIAVVIGTPPTSIPSFYNFPSGE